MLRRIAPEEKDAPARIERQRFDNAKPLLVTVAPTAAYAEMAGSDRRDRNQAEHKAERASRLNDVDGFHGDSPRLHSVSREKAWQGMLKTGLNTPRPITLNNLLTDDFFEFVQNALGV